MHSSLYSKNPSLSHRSFSGGGDIYICLTTHTRPGKRSVDQRLTDTVLKESDADEETDDEAQNTEQAADTQ